MRHLTRDVVYIRVIDMRFGRLLPAAAFLNVAMTCGGWGGPPSESPPLDAGMKAVMEEVRGILEKEGFSIDTYLPEEGRITTPWKVRLGPHRGQGRRERASVQARTQENGIVVSVDIRRQINENISDPWDESKAQWSSAGRNLELQDRIVWLLKLKFTDWTDE